MAMSDNTDMLGELKRCQTLVEQRMLECLLALKYQRPDKSRAENGQSGSFSDAAAKTPDAVASITDVRGRHSSVSGSAADEDGSYELLLEAMKYSLFAGGKRIRPVICLKFCEAVCGDPMPALDAACAIEMLHTYTLIHDDLPCMDDDDFRRGKPSNHAKYGEFVATLAGDALQAAAFETLAKSKIPPGRVAAAVIALSEAAGAHGICAGQYLDISGEGKNLSRTGVEKIHSLKTAALISAAAKIGVIAAGGLDGQVEAAGKYALAVGLAFQIRDDVLDITASKEELGKPIGSDKGNNKNTFFSILGAGECERIISSETEKAISSLRGEFADTGFLVWLAQMLAERKY